MSILEDSVNRRLRIECSEIRLFRIGTPSLSIKGPGSIWIDKFGTICFKFSLATEQYEPYVRARLERPRPIPDEPQDEDYHELRALACSGETLRGKLLYPQVDNDTPEGLYRGPGTASGQVYEIIFSEGNSPEPVASARFLVPRRFELPRLIPQNQEQESDTFSLELGPERINIFKRGEHTEFLISLNPGGIAKNHHWRMIEAIEFAFGQSIYPAAMELQDNHHITKVILSVVPGAERESNLPPPLFLYGHVPRYPVAELIRKYYQYVQSCTEKEYPPQVALALSSMRAAANAEPEAKALMFSVASETLIETCYPEYTWIEGGLEKEICALEKKIREDTTVLCSLRERAAGMVGSMRNRSTSSGLKTFVYTQACNRKAAKQIFDDWRALRNPSTHGQRADPDAFHEILRRTNVVLDLCYSIVLARIGYLGNRIIYDQRAGNPWNLMPKKTLPIPLEKTDEDLLKMIRRQQWMRVGDTWSKTILFAKKPEYSIELIVKAFAKEDGSERFKIEVSPTAVLADAWSCFMIGAKFALCSQAQATCEEIAKRALLCMD